MLKFIYHLVIFNQCGTMVAYFSCTTLRSLQYAYKLQRLSRKATTQRFAVRVLSKEFGLLASMTFSKRISLVSFETFRLLSQNLRNSAKAEYIKFINYYGWKQKSVD